MLRKFFRLLLQRRIVIIFLLILQLALMMLLITHGSSNSVWVEYSLAVISLLVVLHVVSDSSNTAYKLIWVIMIGIFPLFGGLFYLVIRSQNSTRRLRRQLQQLDVESKRLFFLPGDHLGEAAARAAEFAPPMRFLQQFCGFPVYGHSQTAYLPSGEAKFARLLQELQKAEKYIFLEYFIIREGHMWGAILDILKQKAADGLDVRVMYDDVGCFSLPEDYPQRLQELGIKCQVFNPFRPFLSAIQNNRNHRKIAAIDGKVAFTGGVNLGDEYINAVERFGHWKDAAVIVEGDAAWSLTMMFLRMWDMCRGEREDIAAFYPGPAQLKDDGLVQPYSDSPMDGEWVGQQVYLSIINNARRYVHITTPYLIIDDSLAAALELAAKSGVDVRIITPHHPDKWLVHMTSRSYYRQLIRAGVRIYEYTRGFMHAKTFVADDQVAIIGTTNLDYRSLYLHFECGVWMYGSRAVSELRDDFAATLGECQQISEEDCRTSSAVRLLQDILRLFAPLM